MQLSSGGGLGRLVNVVPLAPGKVPGSKPLEVACWLLLLLGWLLLRGLATLLRLLLRHHGLLVVRAELLDHEQHHGATRQKIVAGDAGCHVPLHVLVPQQVADVALCRLVGFSGLCRLFREEPAVLLGDLRLDLLELCGKQRVLQRPTGRRRRLLPLGKAQTPVSGAAKVDTPGRVHGPLAHCHVGLHAALDPLGGDLDALRRPRLAALGLSLADPARQVGGRTSGATTRKKAAHTSPSRAGQDKGGHSHVPLAVYGLGTGP